MEKSITLERAKKYREFFNQHLMASLVNPNDESLVKEFLDSMVEMSKNTSNTIENKSDAKVDSKNKDMEIYINKGDLVKGLSGLPPIWFLRDEGVFFRYDSLIKDYSQDHDMVYILSTDFIGNHQVSMDQMLKIKGIGSKYHGARENFHTNSQIVIEQTPQLIDLAASSFDSSLPSYPDYITPGTHAGSINPYGDDVLIRLGYVSKDE